MIRPKSYVAHTRSLHINLQFKSIHKTNVTVNFLDLPLLLWWHYGTGWALACFTICLQASRSLALSLHLFIPVFLRSVDTSSSHLIFGLPLRFVVYSFPYNIFFLELRCLVLDLPIHQNTQWLGIDIYRKATFTDTTIHLTSNHPVERNLAACRFLRQRMLVFPLTAQSKHKEWNTILFYILPRSMDFLVH